MVGCRKLPTGPSSTRNRDERLSSAPFSFYNCLRDEEDGRGIRKGRGMSTKSMSEPSESARPPGLLRRWLGVGWRLAVGIAVGLALFLGMAIWQIRSLDELPDIGDPFDVAEALRPVDLPDEQNAYVVYATAHPSRFQFPKALSTDRLQNPDLVESRAGGPRVRGAETTGDGAMACGERAAGRPVSPASAVRDGYPAGTGAGHEGPGVSGGPGRIAARRRGCDGPGVGLVSGDAPIQPPCGAAWVPDRARGRRRGS